MMLMKRMITGFKRLSRKTGSFYSIKESAIILKIPVLRVLVEN